MKEYKIARVYAAPDWDTVAKAEIDCCPWGGEYRPRCYGQLVYWQDKGFLVRMTCFETNPKAVYTQPDDTVCKDSCMEFFADFAPETGAGYLNFEANAKGTLLMGLGTQRHGRVRVRSLGCPLPTVTPFATDDCWGYELMIPLEMLEALYGKASFAVGDRFPANLYKCGDDTAVEHYCVWNPVTAPKPDYHRPECFGCMIVE